MPVLKCVDASSLSENGVGIFAVDLRGGFCMETRLCRFVGDRLLGAEAASILDGRATRLRRLLFVFAVAGRDCDVAGFGLAGARALAMRLAALGCAPKVGLMSVAGDSSRSAGIDGTSGGPAVVA